MGLYKRRNIIQLAGLAVGAALTPYAFYRLRHSSLSRESVVHTLRTSTAIPKSLQARKLAMQVLPLPKPEGVSKVVVVHTENRVWGIRRALDLLQPDGIAGKRVFIKPNYNTADPAPAATDTAMLEALIQELQNAKAGPMVVGDRSGMAITRQAMESKGVFQLAERYSSNAIVFDEMPVDQWQYFSAEGTHWQKGFAVARPILQAEAIISTCCLKTHRQAQYTLSLKNTVGMVAKYVPGDPFNYMGDLHSSPHMQRMIAEINATHQPALVVVDGVDAFVKGGPERGNKVAANVMLVGTDRIAIDVVALGILRSLGTTTEVMQGSIWDFDQIRRAIELGVGIASVDQIDLIAADGKSQKMIDQIWQYISV